MSGFFHLIVSQPIYNALVFFYNTIPGHDFGLAVIATTLLLRFLFIPLYRKQLESQREMQILQPKIKELQKQYKGDKAKLNEMQMKLYQEHGVNPLGGCLPIIVQVIFLIAIYRALIAISQGGFAVNGADLYSFIADPGVVAHHFFGIADLAKPSYLFAALAALAQFYQVKMMMDAQKTAVPEKKEAESEEPDFMAIMNKQMLFIGPGMTLFIGVTFPAALSLYWLVSTIFTIVQQIFIFKKK
jgi:YidC/Oxa1 family membrane protein insertase